MEKRKRLAIVNSDSMECAYGGVAPIMRNMHPHLAKHFDIDYIYLPDSWRRVPLPGRLAVMLYLASRRKRLKNADFVLSHIPEGSVVTSWFNKAYCHIYHGNTNPMEGSRYWFGKYFKRIFEHFFRRIERTCPLRYTVGPVWDDVKKLPNPINHSVKPRPVAERTGFIFAGRLEAGKNIDRIITIYSKLPADMRAANHLYIAGTGTREVALRELAARLGLNGQVHFTGMMPNEKLVELDAGRRILLMASDFEGFPTAIAEAFTVGVPVVTTDVGDIPAFVRDGYNGRVFSRPFTDEEYIAGIEDILANEQHYADAALDTGSVFDSAFITEGVVDEIEFILSRNR